MWDFFIISFTVPMASWPLHRKFSLPKILDTILQNVYRQNSSWLMWWRGWWLTTDVLSTWKDKKHENQIEILQDNSHDLEGLKQACISFDNILLLDIDLSSKSKRKMWQYNDFLRFIRCQSFIFGHSVADSDIFF